VAAIAGAATGTDIVTKQNMSAAETTHEDSVLQFLGNDRDFINTSSSCDQHGVKETSSKAVVEELPV
jgi:hypothetical protein